MAAFRPAGVESGRGFGLARGDHARDAVVRALAHARSGSARRAALARAAAFGDAALPRRLHEEALRLARVNLAQAERLARAACWLADRDGPGAERARALRAAGHVESLRGRYRRALACYQRALDLLESPADAVERALTLSGSIQTLIYLGEYARALAWADEARRTFVARGDQLRLARLDTNVGNVLYRQDHFQEAFECYTRAHEALMRAGRPEDVGIVLRNIAVCWISLNDFGAALAAYREARAWCEQHGMPLVVAEADYNVAYLHYLRGDYAAAIGLYGAARTYCERVGDRYHRALCDLDQSEMYLELNLNEEAGRMAARAGRVFRTLRMRYELGKALVNQGATEARAGERELALASFAKARTVFAREKNRHWITIADLYRALVLSESGDLAAAGRLCQAALRHFRRNGPPGKAALCELLRARLQARTGRLEQARVSAEHAILIAEAAEATALAAQGYIVLGEIHEALGSSEAAYAAFRQAHAGLETLRNRIDTEQLKIAFLEDKKAVYESLVVLALEREPASFRARVAFRYIEQAKSRSLADLMAFQPPTPRAGEEAAEQRVCELRQELTWWSRRLSAEGSHTRAGGAPAVRLADRRRARDCEIMLARADAGLDRADAEHRVLGSGRALPLDAIRAVIPAGTAIVEYYEARGRLLACVLTRDRLDIVPLAETGRVRDLIRLLQFQLSTFAADGDAGTRPFAGQSLVASMDHLHELHTALIEPLGPAVGADHLVIVPHGFLHYLPFHALFDGERYLADRATVSYAPSATVYYLCRIRHSAVEARSLVLGVPDPLAPHILDEVEAVASVLPHPTVYLGPDATHERLRTEGEGARYVHVATHGMFRQHNPMFSAVQLGSGDMSLLDLYQLRFSADLVTLSGCGTGLGAVVGGDEQVGLVRGLLHAGARAVLVTLWNVHDRSTADFMRAFYRQVAAGADKGQAMTTAMRDLRAVCPHPYYWAPFVLVGDPAVERAKGS